MALPAFLARRRALVESFRPVVADEPRAPSPGEAAAPAAEDASTTGITLPVVLSPDAIRPQGVPSRTTEPREGFDYAEARAMARYEAWRERQELDECVERMRGGR